MLYPPLHVHPGRNRGQKHTAKGAAESEAFRPDLRIEAAHWFLPVATALEAIGIHWQSRDGIPTLSAVECNPKGNTQ